MPAPDEMHDLQQVLDIHEKRCLLGDRMCREWLHWLRENDYLPWS